MILQYTILHYCYTRTLRYDVQYNTRVVHDIIQCYVSITTRHHGIIVLQYHNTISVYGHDVTWQFWNDNDTCSMTHVTSDLIHDNCEFGHVTRALQHAVSEMSNTSHDMKWTTLIIKRQLSGENWDITDTRHVIRGMTTTTFEMTNSTWNSQMLNVKWKINSMGNLR